MDNLIISAIEDLHMAAGEDFGEGSVEDRIVGEFMRQLQESDVDFEIIEEMEEILDEEDFGGESHIIERVEESVLNDAD